MIQPGKGLGQGVQIADIDAAILQRRHRLRRRGIGVAAKAAAEKITAMQEPDNATPPVRECAHDTDDTAADGE